MRSPFLAHAAKALRHALKTGMFGSAGLPQKRQPPAVPVCAQMHSKLSLNYRLISS